MRKLLLLLTLIVFAGSQLLWAQTKTITGTITGKDDGMPIPGASIVVKGTTIGTVSSGNGTYSISVPENSTVLVVSFIGMESLEVLITNRSKIDVELSGTSVGLDEVIAVGYGVTKKSSLTGSIGTVNSKEISDVPVANAGQALQGKTTGVQVVASSGRPGAAAIVKVRGVGSINAGTNPLFVIDGVYMSASDFSSLNSNDIESITVLKDASATAIYGSRAANGVVIVTTRRGDVGKNTITAKAQWGITNKTQDRFEMMNASEKLTYEKQLGVGLGKTLTDKEIAEYPVNTDWADEVFSTGTTQIYDVAISGGSGGTRYMVSGQYYNQKTMVYGSDYEKFTGRFNLEQKILENLKFDVKVGTGSTKESVLRTSRNALNPFNYIYSANPYVAPFNEDGSYNLDPKMPNSLNIFEQIDNNPQDNSINRTIGAVSLEWEIVKGLKVKTTEGINYLNLYSYYYVKPESGLSQLLGSPYGYRTDTYQKALTFVTTNQLSYETTFADKHDVKVMVATEANKYDYRETVAAGSGFATGKIDALSTASTPEAASGGETAWRMLSYFGMGNYVYDNKYFLDLSVRRDGSSRFGENAKYGTFWAAGIGWSLKNENFLTDVEFVDQLKLRASTGVSGNNSIGDYAAQGVFSYGSYANNSTAYPSRLPNPDLTWEKNYQTSVGLDATVYDERISLTADYYMKKTTDMLLSRPLSMTSGFGSRIENVGEMENNGIELSLSGYVIKNNDLSLKLYANTSYNVNKVTKLYNGEDINVGWNNLISEGLPIYNYKMVRWAGVNPANGEALYLDKDDKITNVYDESNSVVLDDYTPLPKYYGSFGLNMEYKGFELNADFYYSYGNYIYNHNSFFTLSDGNSAATKNLDRRLLTDQWRKPGDITNIPFQSASNSSYMSTRYLEDASYVRLRNLTIAYKLPSNFLKKLKLESMRVFATGNNLLTFTGFTGLDPEIGDAPAGSGTGSQGSVLDFSYPASRTIMFGIELGL